MFAYLEISVLVESAGFDWFSRLLMLKGEASAEASIRSLFSYNHFSQPVVKPIQQTGRCSRFILSRFGFGKARSGGGRLESLISLWGGRSNPPSPFPPINFPKQCRFGVVEKQTKYCSPHSFSLQSINQQPKPKPAYANHQPQLESIGVPSLSLYHHSHSRVDSVNGGRKMGYRPIAE